MLRALALLALLGAYAVVQPSERPVAPAMRPAAEQNPLRGTEAEAIAYAAQSGAPVEIGAFRSETRTVLANPDGTLTSTDHAEPVRVAQSGQWVPVDPSLEQRADGSIVPRAVAFGLSLSDGGDGPLLTAERAGRRFSLDAPGTLRPPVITDNRVTYPNVFPDVDLVVTVSATDFSHVLLVRTPEAARTPGLASLEFGVQTDGLTLRPTAADGLEVVDTASGGAVFEAGTPMMWDSGPAVLRASDTTIPESDERTPVGVAVTDEAVTLTPDQAMLTSPQTRFPVVIDPVWTDSRASAWAMVASGYPGQSYYKFKDDQGVGLCPVSSNQCEGTGKKRLYYALPTPFSGKTILTAELAITMTHKAADDALNVSVYRATSGIGSGTTWNNQPGLGTLQDTRNPTGTKPTCEKDNQNVAWDVKQAISEAATRKWSTTTFAVRANSETNSDYWKRFCNNAILRVKYNRGPNIPAQRTLKNSPGGDCVSGAARPYTDKRPVLQAVLTDPDRNSSNTEQLTGEFRIFWTAANGSQVLKTYRTGRKASGSTFTIDTNTVDNGGLAIPENTTIGWDVRANDGITDGQWSWFGDQTVCEFVLDKTWPAAPDVDSAEYLPLDASETTGFCRPDEIAATDPEQGPSPSWRGWVGKYGTFTFDAAATDVVEYWYGFDTNPSPANVLRPADAGGPVSVTWMPQEVGPHFITVTARDRASHSSAIATCIFHVPNRLSIGSWALSDTGPQAADARSANPATAGAGVTFGVSGPACAANAGQCTTDRAVRLSGNADAYLATAGQAPVVNTGAGFSVAAWVRLTDDTKNHVAVSQDGAGRPGFKLGFDGRTKKWIFSTPVSPVAGIGTWLSTGGTPATKDVWTHLAGVYDPVRATMQLYVNGVAQPVAAKRTPWASFGALQFGRSREWNGYHGHWAGDLADINVFDRIVVPAEIRSLALQRAQRKVYWPMDEQTGSVTEPYNDPAGPELTLVGGARIYAPDQDTVPSAEQPLVGSGHLILDGVDDHATTTGPVAATGTSFTVSVRVRLASATCNRNMAVIAQAGTRESGFQIRCSAQNTWEAVLPRLDGSDSTRPPVILTGNGLPSADQTGQQLVLVHDAFLRQALFYVDGQLADTAVGSFTAPWSAGGPLTVGRAMRTGAYGDHLSGVVDEVRVYGGVLDESLVQLLGIIPPETDL